MKQYSNKKKYVDTQDRHQALKIGDTMNGKLTITIDSGNSGLIMNSDLAKMIIETHGISVQHRNLAVNTSAGGCEIDVLQTYPIPARG